MVILQATNRKPHNWHISCTYLYYRPTDCFTWNRQSAVRETGNQACLSSLWRI